MQHVEPELITDGLLDGTARISPFVPEHLPREIALIELMRDRHPHVAADRLLRHGVPSLHAARGEAASRFRAAFDVEGRASATDFTGFRISFSWRSSRVRLAPAARGRVILAHLGAGASLAAVRDGKSVDTSMGFSPASGLVMGTRGGDMDAGLVAFLARDRSR